MNDKQKLQPTVFVIFGGAGDLSWRKLIPSLFDLFKDQSLPDQYSILIVDRDDLNHAQLCKHLYEGTSQFSRHGKVQQTDWQEFAKHIQYLAGYFTKPLTYNQIKHETNILEKKWNNAGNLIFYMATPPGFFSIIPPQLSKAGLSQDKKNRLVVEKPIGYDLESTIALNQLLATSFDETQIFRIDHYLGKGDSPKFVGFPICQSFI